MKQFNKLLYLTLLLLGIYGFNIKGLSQIKNSYHIQNGVEIDKSGCDDLTQLVIILPYAQTNQYQTVTNVNSYLGELLDIPETDDKYLRYILSQSDIQNYGNTFEIFYEFDITLNSINFDFGQITEIYPYDTTSDIYLWNTGASGEYIDPDNTIIQAIGDEIWSQSSDIVNYAEHCYEYVAENYDYINANTGLHTLNDILSAGGGDCGNLSSIYVSLLRYKNIPSRHIVTVRPNGTYHIWTDFYLENYGWIPVDVTYKQSNPSGDYFGIYDGNGIVMTKKVWLYLEKTSGDYYYAPLLQNYHWWYWYSSGGCNSINSQHVVNSSQLTSIQTIEQGNFIIYNNPVNDRLKILTSVSLDNSKIEIYSISGRLVGKTSLNDNNEINISDLSNGIYIIKINSENINFVKKIIKE